MEKFVKDWTKKAQKLLVGRKVTNVRYATREEQGALGIYSRPIVIEFGGIAIFPMCDAEGNDAGVLYTTNHNLPIMPNI